MTPSRYILNELDTELAHWRHAQKVGGIADRRSGGEVARPMACVVTHRSGTIVAADAEPSREIRQSPFKAVLCCLLLIGFMVGGFLLAVWPQ